MTSAYHTEVELAVQAVHRASIVTKNVMNGIESVDKSDASPVTIADFAAQALIISAIKAEFPEDRFVAEESADMLRKDMGLRTKVWRLVETANASIGKYSNRLATPKDEDEMMEIISLGSKEPTPTSGRVWILDPVDGTATFLKGQQYAVCLSLTVDGKQKVGVLGCPNLKPGERRVEEELVDRDGYGVVVSAEIGQGTSIASMMKNGLGSRKPVKRAPEYTDVGDLQFIDSIKSSHADIPSHRKVHEKLGVTKQHLNFWSMQVKYVALALGASDAIIRIPPNRKTRALVWDHAGGQLIFTEAGGKIVDLDGKEFDFAKGREFGDNWGWVGADATVFDTVFQATLDVLKERA